MLRPLLRKLADRLAPVDPLWHVRRNTLTVRSLDHLMLAMGWTQRPDTSAEHLHRFDYLEDLNQRRLHDAEMLLAACCNGQPKTILEIGTARGLTTALMAQHAPQAIVHTVNIPPEEIDRGGRHVTFAPSRQEIGSAYREAGCTNVRQILANTATWEPDCGPIDVAFIDGCHDSDFVFNDTRRILAHCRPGSLVLWHDFNPDLARQYPWIAEVCRGVEQLYAQGWIHDRILHLQDSWIGLYVVPAAQGAGAIAA